MTNIYGVSDLLVDTKFGLIYCYKVHYENQLWKKEKQDKKNLKDLLGFAIYSSYRA